MRTLRTLLLAFLFSPIAVFAQEPAAEAPETSKAGEDAPADAGSEPGLPVIPVPEQSAKAEAPPAQEPAPSTALEAVVVMATKRAAQAQNVPISMSVMSDKFIRDQGMTDITDALLFVPNFKVTEVAGRVAPQCRGFTVSEGNPAFESPCGLALDGIAFSRGAYFSAGLFDVSRIEVLRGPQGTTFGKNTTAGVVSLYTKDPTDGLSANADLQYGIDGPGVKRAEAGVGGPIVPGMVNFRVAGLLERRQGYMENTYHEQDPSVEKESGGHDRDAYRVKLAFPNVFGAQIKLTHEYTQFENTGFLVKLIPTSQVYADYTRQYDPNADFGENYKTSNRGSQVRTKTRRTQGELNFRLADWDMTAVGAFGELNNDQRLAPLPSPMPLAQSHRQERSPYVTGELRAVSPDFNGLFGLDDLFGIDLGRSSVLVGLFGQDARIKELKLDSDVYYTGVVALIAAGLPAPALPLSTIDQIVETLFGENVLKESFHIRFSQKARTAALFTQVTWNMSEKLTLDLGARLSRENKSSHHDVSYSTPAPLFNTTGDRGYVKNKQLSNTSLQPKVSLGYAPTRSVNLFAHWARGFKSGGFNAYTSTGDPEKPNATNPNATTGSLTYGDESVTDWGFDVKTMLFRNRMRLNLSLFREDLKNYQVLTEVLGTEIPVSGVRLPNGYQQVVNAGKARAQGVELDMMVRATDWLTVLGSVGYNATKYLSFPLDACAGSEEPDPDTGKCDHSGKTFLGVPKLTSTLSVDTRFPLGGLWGALGNTQFLLGGTMEYVGPQYVGSYDSYNYNDGYFRYRAHAGFANPAQGWSLRVTALNLTDDFIAQRSRDPNTAITLGPLAPRTIYAQLSWNYH